MQSMQEEVKEGQKPDEEGKTIKNMKTVVSFFKTIMRSSHFDSIDEVYASYLKVGSKNLKKLEGRLDISPEILDFFDAHNAWEQTDENIESFFQEVKEHGIKEASFWLTRKPKAKEE